MKIAIVGGGIAGNMAAALLHASHDITLFEADRRLGGHVHTHEVERFGRRYAVDTGFIVYNERTYPRFTRLLQQLGVATQESEMSFSLRCERSGLEYNGASLDTLFAQRANLLRPSFIGMVRDILRFHREARRLLDTPGDEVPLGEILERGRYGRGFVENYIVPMGAAIWSTDPGSMLLFPARFFVRFLDNHGMLTVNRRPVWRTVSGGSMRYVERLTAAFRDRVRLATPVRSLQRVTGGVVVHPRGAAPQRFDAVFVACHSDQALAMLADPSPLEREALGAIGYQQNEAVLHTDATLMPRRKRAWASWNYHRLAHDRSALALTYDMSRLQRLASPEPFLVTLNRTSQVDPRRVIARMTYHHPLFTPAAVAAQALHARLNHARTFFCGAYWGFGFHEDGVASAMAAVDHFDAVHGVGGGAMRQLASA